MSINDLINETTLNLLVDRISVRLPAVQQVVREIQTIKETLVKETKTVIDSQEVLNLQNSISKLSPDTKNYVQEVMHKARINKAAKIHEHGISLAKTAALLGVSQWELSDYASGKKDEELEKEFGEGVSVKRRVKIVEGFFGNT